MSHRQKSLRPEMFLTILVRLGGNYCGHNGQEKLIQPVAVSLGLLPGIDADFLNSTTEGLRQQCAFFDWKNLSML